VLAEQCELVGLFGVDTIIAEDEVWTLEVNPRYTASVEIVERFSGVKAIALHAAACGGQFESQRAGASSPPAAVIDSLLAGAVDGPAHAQSTACGKAILYARRDIEVLLPLFEKAMLAATELPWPRMADISPVGTPIEAGRPICTLFAEGETVDDVEQRLRHHAAILEEELYS
jgi:predicted ATP-grasp superfamily ATP-dependent carboligase